jgi:hypothetical protein
VNRILAAALTIAFVATPVLAADAPAGAPAVTAIRGKMLMASDGARLAPIYRVSNDGAQIILDGRMVTVPTNTIAADNGKVSTSLTKAQVIALP